MNYNNYFIPKQLDLNIKKKLSSLLQLPTNDINYEMAGRNQIKLLLSFINWLKEHLLQKYNLKLSDMVLTETNSGFGGLTYLFQYYFKKINIIDIDNDRLNFIKNNISIYHKYTDVKSTFRYYEDNYCVSKDDIKLKQDIIFSDFPWGGPSYKNVKSLRLCIEDISKKPVYLEDVILDLYKKNLYKFYVVLLPFNFDMEYFDKFAINNKIVYDIFKIPNIKERLLVVINHNAFSKSK